MGGYFGLCHLNITNINELNESFEPVKLNHYSIPTFNQIPNNVFLFGKKLGQLSKFFFN